MAFDSPFYLPLYVSDLRHLWPAPTRTRSKNDIDTVVIHRAGGPGWPTETELLVDALLPHWPGNRIPYWAFVEPTGRVVVTSDIERKGSHAGRWNHRGLGIAVVGDFREYYPTTQQLEGTAQFVAWVLDTLQLPVGAVRGHSDLPGSTRSPSKVCPGPMLNLDELRGMVQDHRSSW